MHRNLILHTVNTWYKLLRPALSTIIAPKVLYISFRSKPAAVDFTSWPEWVSNWTTYLP